MSKHRERAREIRNKFRGKKSVGQSDIDLIQAVYEKALSEQRGEIIDAVKTIVRKHSEYYIDGCGLLDIEKAIQEIEGLREVK
jgi:hypothetical protein